VSTCGDRRAWEAGRPISRGVCGVGGRGGGAGGLGGGRGGGGVRVFDVEKATENYRLVYEALVELGRRRRWRWRSGCPGGRGGP
jgi:hypothetical protein